MLTVLQTGGVDTASDWAALVQLVHHLLLAVAHTVLLDLVLLVVLHSETVRLAPWLAVTALVLGCARVIDGFVLLASATTVRTGLWAEHHLSNLRVVWNSSIVLYKLESTSCAAAVARSSHAGAAVENHLDC